MDEDQRWLLQRVTALMLVILAVGAVPYAVIVAPGLGGLAALDAGLPEEVRAIRFAASGLLASVAVLLLCLGSLLTAIGLWRGTWWGWGLGLVVCAAWSCSGCGPCALVAVVLLAVAGPPTR